MDDDIASVPLHQEFLLRVNGGRVVFNANVKGVEPGASAVNLNVPSGLDNKLAVASSLGDKSSY